MPIGCWGGRLRLLWETLMSRSRKARRGHQAASLPPFGLEHLEGRRLMSVAAPVIAGAYDGGGPTPGTRIGTPIGVVRPPVPLPLPVPTTSVTIHPKVNQALTGVVGSLGGTFTPVSSTPSIMVTQATITWGDGGTSAGTFVKNAKGGWDVV